MRIMHLRPAVNQPCWKAICLMLAFTALVPSYAEAQSRLQAGTLTCKGEGGWGVIIASKKKFRCTFSSSDGANHDEYVGTIRKLGIDVGKTGSTSLVWLVFGPASKIGNSYVEGSLAGTYAGVGAEATVGVGLGANVLVGGGADSFALQPVSVQVQTGLSIAAGVESLELEYVGPSPS